VIRIPAISALAAWKARARGLKREIFALSFAVRDPRVAWYAKVAAACVVAYALSPIDLIPDFIPVLGYLDDLVLVPLGVWLVVRLIPADVLAECRARAHRVSRRARSWVAAAVIVGIWLLLAGLTLWWTLGWGGD
jgi:uncharacterized membrane protein YkvA (DUF1232 family)